MLGKFPTLRPIPLAALTLTLLASAAQAQSQDQSKTTAAKSDADMNVLEQVVVTVQRRKEKLQDVPVAATAIGAADLELRGIGNIADLSALAPNLMVLHSPGTASASQIAIRGSVTSNPALFWESTVGMYVDGVFMGKGQGSIFDLVDLERVEVLRGPQGTLYGRNTLAGAINMITRKPSGELGGHASIDLGNFNSRVEKLSLDLPSMGPLKASIGLRDEKRDGWIKTTAGSSVPEMNSRGNSGGRVALTLDASRDLQIDYRYDWTKANQASSFSQIVKSDVATMFYIPGIIVNQERQTKASLDSPAFERLNIAGNSLTAEYKVGANDTLKYILSHRTMQYADGLDLDGSPIPLAMSQRHSDYSQDSNELQWLGSHGDLSYVGGIYSFKDDGFTNNPQSFFFGAQNFDSRYGFTTNALSVYGQADYKLSENTTLTGGLRNTKEDKTVRRQLSQSGIATTYSATGVPTYTPYGPIILVPTGTSGATSFSATTPMLSLGYKVHKDLNVYARYSEGFKSGGFNGEAQSVAAVLTPFRPEKLKSMELGLKTTFDQNRGQLNVAVFNNRTTDLQQPIFTAKGSVATDVRNVGTSTAQGLEVEAQWRPTRDLRLQVGYGYMSAKFNEFMELGVNVANNRAYVYAPKNTLNLLVDTVLARTSMGTLRGVVDYNYTDSYYLYAYQLTVTDPGSAGAANTLIKPSGIVNLRLNLENISLWGNNATASLWVRNATDNAQIANKIDFGPGFANLTPAYFNEPRTFGVSLGVKW